MSVKDKFINYVKIDTESDPHSGVTPSTEKQYELLNLLLKELQSLNIESKLEKGYVYGHLKSNLDYKCKTVGYIAHVDTSPDYSGKDVKPKVISNWDGSDINLGHGKVTSLKDFPHMSEFVGDDIIVTDGSTLLGADDKAGVAIIMEHLEYLVKNPDIKHGDIKVCFTPDEEIGKGTVAFDVDYFNADFAYTLDGDKVNVFAYETFNAYSIDVDIEGVAVHPGGAKNKLVNAINLANKFDSLLPVSARPEYTENYEGFNHLHTISGSAASVKMGYIIRNHDNNIIQKQIDTFNRIAEFINDDLGYKAIKLNIELSYKNMYEILKDQKEVIDIAVKAIENSGLKVEIEAIRGGTDGSHLTFMGLPCPNLGTGGTNYHGPYEACSINQMEKACEVVMNVTKIVSELKV